MSAGQATGGSDWVRAVLDRYEGPLIRYAQRLLGDPERACDVVQETFLKLCRQRPGDVDGHLAQWLFTVCRNAALDVRRKEKRMTTLTRPEPLGMESREPVPAAAIEQRDTVARVLKLIDALPDNQQEVVRLRFQAELSYREIAEVTGLSDGNVGFLLHQALKSIRERLEKDAV